MLRGGRVRERVKILNYPSPCTLSPKGRGEF